MNFLYNGNNHTLEAPRTILDFLVKIGKSKIPMMVKLNDNSVPIKDLGNIMLVEGDTLNVILYMGGG